MKNNFYETAISQRKLFLFATILLFFVFHSPFVKATEIPKEKLLSLATQFLKEKKIQWGTAVEVRKHTSPCHVVVVILNLNNNRSFHEETWPACYEVVYPTSKVEFDLKGGRSVVISLDGSLVGLTPRE